jgi:NitT/TauT family transport system permease protein
VYTQLVDGRRDLQQKSSMKNPFVIQRATRKRPAQAFKSSEDLAEKSSPMNFMVRLRPVVFIGILLVVWHIAVAYQKVHLLPTPLAVARGIVELAQRGLLLKYVVASLFRVTWGFTGAAILAIPFGLALGWNRRSEIALNPLIQILRPVSPLAWIPMSILWFGVGDMAAIFLIFLASFLPLTVTAVNAVAGIPAVHINAGRNFGLSPSQLVYRVLCPAVVPQLIIGLRITLGIAWLVVVAAEMIAVNSGLGFLIVDARNAGNRYDLVVAGMVMIGSIGFLLDIGMRSLEKSKPLRWGYSEE